MIGPERQTMLRRFWYPLPRSFGIGVTAASEAEARTLAESTMEELGIPGTLGAVVADVDVSSLDAGHVLPNVGPSAVRGVWYPMRNV